MNLLGSREPEHYGRASLEEINQHLTELAEADNNKLVCKQSNAENELVDWIQQTLSLHQKTLQDLHELQFYLSKGALDKITLELEDFLSPDWLREIPFEQWRHCTRILNCYLRRIEKIREESDSELEKQEKISKYFEKSNPLWKRKDELNYLQLWTLKHYRWMIEEYKISIFAQNLKTAFPISEKRLDKFWNDKIVPVFPSILS